jgi:hypothetical protein
MARPMVDIFERMMRDVHFVPESGCWLYAGHADREGYGTLGWKRPDGIWTKLFAHRLSYERLAGPLIPGMMVCHKCDTPPCVNPAHLFLGTASDNMVDCSRKNRRPKGKGCYPSIMGTKNHKAKLTADDVVAIRRDFRPGLGPTLAELFGVESTAIYRVVHGRTYLSMGGSTEKSP